MAIRWRKRDLQACGDDIRRWSAVLERLAPEDVFGFTTAALNSRLPTGITLAAYGALDKRLGELAFMATAVTEGERAQAQALRGAVGSAVEVVFAGDPTSLARFRLARDTSTSFYAEWGPEKMRRLLLDRGAINAMGAEAGWAAH